MRTEKVTQRRVFVHCKRCGIERHAYHVRDIDTRKTYARCTYCGTYNETREEYGNACLPLSMPFSCTYVYVVATSDGRQVIYGNGNAYAVCQDARAYVVTDAETHVSRTVPVNSVLRAASRAETNDYLGGNVAIPYATETEAGLLVPCDYVHERNGN